MSTGTTTPTKSTPPPYRMTVDEYERIGSMLDDSQVELIDGADVRVVVSDTGRAGERLLSALSFRFPSPALFRARLRGLRS